MQVKSEILNTEDIKRLFRTDIGHFTDCATNVITFSITISATANANYSTQLTHY